jgi:hypothetical protein
MNSADLDGRWASAPMTISRPRLASRDYGDRVGLFNFPSESDRIADDVQQVAGQAHRAMREGRTVFLARINTGLTEPSATGVLVSATEIIQAVENLGWRLEQMSYVSRTDVGFTEGYFLFRLLPHPNHTLSDQQQPSPPSGP